MTVLIFIFLRAGRNFSQLSALITIHTLIFGFFLPVWPKFRPAFPLSAHISNCFPIQHIPLGSRVSTKPTYTPQVKEQQRYGSLNSKQNYPQRIYVYFLFLLTWPKFRPVCAKTIKTHGVIHQTGPSWPKFRPGPSKLEITSRKWIPLSFFGSWPKLRLAFPLVPLETCMCISTF